MDATTFTKNRDRLLDGEVAAKFLAALLSHDKVKGLLSCDHFSVDGTLLEAWANRPTAARFLGDLISAVPYRVHTVLTDNGLQFTDLPRIRNGEIARHRFHPFDEICRANGIEHRLTKPTTLGPMVKSSG